MAPNTSHTHTHTLGLQDHPWELTWPCPLPLSAGVCPEQTGPLSVGNRGGLRPCCLAGAEGAAGCQWSVAAGASGNGVTLALTAPPPATLVLTPASVGVQGTGARVEKRTALLRPSSWTRRPGWAHSGRRPKKRRARTPLTSALSPWSHCAERSSSSTVSTKTKCRDSLRFNRGQSDDRERRYVLTGLRPTASLQVQRKYRDSGGVQDGPATEKRARSWSEVKEAAACLQG